MPKAFVFIDHDMIVRHFVLADAFRELERAFDVTYVFNDDISTDKTWINVDVESLGLGRVLTTNVPRKRMGSWYKLYAISVLNAQRGTANYRGRRERMADINGWPRTIYYELLSLPGIFQFTRRKFLHELGTYAPLEELIDAEAPDIVIHPSILTGYYINELLPICKTRGIPTLVLMNAWDNPSQKAITTSLPDKLGVWGTQTRDHAIEFMRMPPEQIEILGAAQFDLYRTPVSETDDELRAMFRVPKGKPILLYGGVSKSINETRHLRLLEEAIESGAIQDCHVLYRPHPWRGGLVEGEENFFDIDFKHVSMDPHMTRYYQRILDTGDDNFDMAEYEVTKKLLTMIAGTVSSMSTIQLETALFGKPSISFMPGPDMATKYGKSTAIGFRLMHFRGLWECPGVEICDSDAGLADAINRLLDQSHDPDMRRTIQDYARQYAELEGPTYAERLRDLSLGMAQRGQG